MVNSNSGQMKRDGARNPKGNLRRTLLKRRM